MLFKKYINLKKNKVIPISQNAYNQTLEMNSLILNLGQISTFNLL